MHSTGNKSILEALERTNNFMRNCMNEVISLLKAKIKCIWIDTYEESEVITDLKEILSKEVIGPRLKIWSHTEGMTDIPLNPNEKIELPNKELMHPRNMFEHIKECQNGFGEIIESSNLFVLRDLHLLIESHEIKRTIRDIKEYNSPYYNPIVVISPIVNIPIELEKLFTVVTYDLPDKSMIQLIVSNITAGIRSAKLKGKDYDVPTDEEQRQFVKACIGLTKNEICDIFAKSLMKYNKLSLQAILDEKIQLVKKSGVLEYAIPKFTFDDLGGNKAFKDWVIETQDAMTEEAREFGIAQPKGYMAFGVPGTSKTMGAEALASFFHVPLLTLDMAKVMNSLVGNSEKKIDQALRVAQSCAPCVLLMDEVEKLFGGSRSSNTSDSGTLNRVMARCLNFLNDNESVFVIMTSNDVSQLPPEFTRSGRLDAQWYFSLPNEEERKEIFKIHFDKTGRNVSDSIIKQAAKSTENYTGAEIKEIVKVAMRKAYQRFKKDGNREILKEDVTAAVHDVIPLYISSKEKIIALERFASGRARNANTIKSEVRAKTGEHTISDRILRLG